jgi:hypothetical protein
MLDIWKWSLNVKATKTDDGNAVSVVGKAASMVGKAASVVGYCLRG